MTAAIYIVAFDGDRIYFNDVSDVTSDTLAKVEPHLSEKESRHLKAARSQGYSVAQQFVYAVTAESTYRTHQLLCEV